MHVPAVLAHVLNYCQTARIYIPFHSKRVFAEVKRGTIGINRSSTNSERQFTRQWAALSPNWITILVLMEHLTKQSLWLILLWHIYLFVTTEWPAWNNARDQKSNAELMIACMNHSKSVPSALWRFYFRLKKKWNTIKSLEQNVDCSAVYDQGCPADWSWSYIRFIFIRSKSMAIIHSFLRRIFSKE